MNEALTVKNAIFGYKTIDVLNTSILILTNIACQNNICVFRFCLAVEFFKPVEIKPVVIIYKSQIFARSGFHPDIAGNSLTIVLFTIDHRYPQVLCLIFSQNLQ